MVEAQKEEAPVMDGEGAVAGALARALVARLGAAKANADN